MIIHFDDTELEVLVDDNSYRRRAVKEKDKLVLYHSRTMWKFPWVGAWVEYEGQVYSLFKASNFTKNSTRNFSYTLTLESGWAGAEKYKVKNPVDGRLKFPYTAKPHEFIQLIVDNMNMRESGWVVGECIDAVEQVISFNHAYCSDALNQIAARSNISRAILWHFPMVKEMGLRRKYPGRTKAIRAISRFCTFKAERITLFLASMVILSFFYPKAKHSCMKG